MSKTFVEPMQMLEPRKMLNGATPPRVLGVTADNRGEVVIQFSERMTGLQRKNVKMFGAGNDGIVGTVDDPGIAAEIIPNSKRFTVTLRANLAPGTGYRVRVNDVVVSTTTGLKLDGEFTGTLPTGNGTAGGSFSFQGKTDRRATPFVRFSTNVGNFDVQVFRSAKPANAANFLQYADSGRYDGLIVSRKIEDFILQAGGIRTTNNTSLSVVTPFAPTIGEPGGISNAPYTLSLALPSDQNGPLINNGTNQFFINTGNNTNLDASFTVFGQVTTRGRSVIDRINDISNLAALSDSLRGTFQPSTSVPMVSLDGLTGSVQNIQDQDNGGFINRFVITGGLNVAAQFVTFTRVATLFRVFPV
jgi:peptidyl-prolyl cis-trans isomerase A (cyclophilin A)